MVGGWVNAFDHYSARTVTFGVKRDGRSTREVKIASSSAESSEEAYFVRIIGAVMEVPVWGSSATVQQSWTWHVWESQASPQVMIGYRPRTEERPQSGIFLSGAHGDRAATCEVAESGKTGMPRTVAVWQNWGFPVALQSSSGTLGLSRECNCATPTPYRLQGISGKVPVFHRYLWTSL